MFDFLKKDDTDAEFAKAVVRSLIDIREFGDELKKEIESNNLKWNDEAVQSFLPIALNYTDFEWLELIAKKEKNEDYQIIKEFLDHVQHLMRNGTGILIEKAKEFQYESE